MHSVTQNIKTVYSFLLKKKGGTVGIATELLKEMFEKLEEV